MEYTKNRVLLFNGNKYALWSGRMEVHLLEQGYEVWEIVDKGFTPISDEHGKKNMVCDAKAKDLIISGIIESIYLKVLSCKTVKEVWGKLENIYVGDSNVKEAKLQIFREKFNQLKMREDEDIAAYFQRVDETTNTLEGLGEPIETKIVVRNILITFPIRFNPKDEEKEEEEEELSDKEFTYFTQKMRTPIGKFKGKLPLICFDYGEVENFATKCPNKNEAVTNGKKGLRKFNKQGKKKLFKKNFFTKEYSSSPKNIVPHLKKTVIMKKNSREEYCLWPSTISMRHLMKKYMKKKKWLRFNFKMK
eukprot:PITA_22500